MSKISAGALIIRNLKLFDDSVKLFMLEVDPTIFSALEQQIKKWVELKTNWYGTFNWNELETIMFAPKEWVVRPFDTKGVDQTSYSLKGVPPAFAYFSLGARQEDDTSDVSEKYDQYWLTRLCRVGRNSIGFLWQMNTDALPVTSQRKTKLKEIARHHADALSKHGFVFEEKNGNFFLPIEIDSENLAKAYESEAIDDALTSVMERLERVAAATGEFTKLVSAARKEFKKRK